MASSLRIEELKKKFDENPRRYFAPLANEYRKAGDVAEAIRICRAHLPQQPGHMSGHIVFGQALYESGELEESRQVFEAALALDPENLIALRHLGDIARIHGDGSAARRWYERVLEADPRNDEISGLIAALPGAAAAGASESASGASGWGDVNPEAPSSGTGRETPTFTNAISLLDLDEPAAPEPVQPLAGFEATSPAPEAVESVAASEPEPAAEFPEFDAPPPPSVTESATVAFQAVRPQTPAGFPSIEVEEGAPPLDSAKESREFDLDAFEAETQYSSSSAVAASPPSSGSASLDDDFPTLDQESPAEAPRAETPASARTVEITPQRWDRTPVSMEAQAGEPTADAHAASPADYGFETMEFVPPVRDTSARSEFDVEVRDIDPADATPAAFVTETMAELYLQQGFRDEALNVYRQLLAQNPNDPGLRERVYQLEHGARSSISMAAMVDPTPLSSPAVREPAATPDTLASPSDALPGPDLDWGERAPARAERRQSPGAPNARSFFANLAARRAPEWYEPAAYDAPSADGPAYDAPAATSYDAGYARDNGGATGEATDSDASALSAADAIEPASLDYMSHGTPDTPLPTIAELSAPEPEVFGAGSRDGDRDAPRPASLTPGGSVDALFGHAAVGHEDERAAHALAGVFSEGNGAASAQPVQGRPTRAASSEISLDHVFRDNAQKAAPRRSAGFSFDQFFSESAGGTASATPAPQGNASEAAESSGDIEQFNAWLEGLKKK